MASLSLFLFPDQISVRNLLTRQGTNLFLFFLRLLDLYLDYILCCPFIIFFSLAYDACKAVCNVVGNFFFLFFYPS